MNNKKCIGCGSTLQNENKDKLGYTPLKINSKTNYCERCFKITHYNEKLIVNLNNINEYIIREVNKKAKYVFFMIDLLNINEETLNTFKKINCEKTLIISKLDIIPKSIKDNIIIEWLKEEYNIEENIIFLSTKKNINTRQLNKILETNKISEAYILGYTNAGKSTLINKICEQNDIKNREITTSILPNTTIDFITIQINENIKLIDSPGFVQEQSIYSEDEFELMKNILPKNTIKPMTEQTKENTILKIADKIIIKPKSKNSFTFYLSNTLKIEKTFKKEEYHNIEAKEYNIKPNSDIVIKGIGFVNIKKECKIEILCKDHNLIEIRNSMFK